MSAARLMAGLLAAGGIVAGTAAGNPPAQTPARTGGYYVLAADLHVHSFFGDGAVAPWEIVRDARYRGLDVVAITNHNQRVGARIAAWSARAAGQPLVLVGQEITAPRFHMVGLGLSRTVDWRLGAKGAAEAVHAQGGVAIAAHPEKASWGAADAEALQALDGVEIGDPFPDTGDPWSGYFVQQFFERAAGINGDLAPIGASDFHFARSLGRCRTYVLAGEISERGVLEAIRQARTVSEDGEGVLIGDPALVSRIERYRAERPRTPRPAWRSLPAVALLAGLVLLVLVK